MENLEDKKSTDVRDIIIKMKPYTGLCKKSMMINKKKSAPIVNNGLKSKIK
ncbi:MAG: hypothetical protein ACKUBY_04490 [Candidatus Moraniibacteriota bacterium]